MLPEEDSLSPRSGFFFSRTNLGHCRDACDNHRFRVLISLMEKLDWKYRNPGFGRNHENQRSGIISLSFAFLGVSVARWCKGLVFWLRLHRAVARMLANPRFFRGLKGWQNLLPSR